MGTNLYTRTREACPNCGCAGDRIHIGKLSRGWAFLFRGYRPGAADNPDGLPVHGLTSYRAWTAFLVGKVIRDEYGEAVDLFTLLAWIENARGGLTARTASDAEWGPSGREFETVDADGYRFTFREFG